jgi:hypothetical protein
VAKIHWATRYEQTIDAQILFGCKLPLFYFHQVAILVLSSWQDPEIDQDISKWWLIGTGYLVN